MSDRANIVAVGLLTKSDLNMLGAGFKRAFPIDDTPCFADLLRRFDQLDQESLGDDMMDRLRRANPFRRR